MLLCACCGSIFARDTESCYEETKRLRKKPVPKAREKDAEQCRTVKRCEFVSGFCAVLGSLLQQWEPTDLVLVPSGPQGNIHKLGT